MNQDDLMLKLADVLQANSLEVNEHFVLNDDNWDSVGLLGAIAAIDEVYHVTVPANELKGCKTVGAVLKLVERSVAEA